MRLTYLSNVNWVISQGLRRFYLLVLLLFTSSTVIGQSLTHETAQNSYSFDFLTFKAFDGNKAFVEVFCKVPYKNLQFTKVPDGFTAYYNLEITLFTKKNVPVETTSYTDSVKVDSSKEARHLSTYSEIIRFTFDR